MCFLAVEMMSAITFCYKLLFACCRVMLIKKLCEILSRITAVGREMPFVRKSDMNADNNASCMDNIQLNIIIQPTEIPTQLLCGFLKHCSKVRCKYSQKYSIRRLSACESQSFTKYEIYTKSIN